MINKTEEWERLNREHSEIVRKIRAKFGKSDISHEDDPELYEALKAIDEKKRNLEASMTDAEFVDMIYS